MASHGPETERRATHPVRPCRYMARSDLRGLRALLATLRTAGVTKYTDGALALELGPEPQAAPRKAPSQAPEQKRATPPHGLSGPYAELASEMWPDGMPGFTERS
jgi:hypothetical protein